MELPFYNRRLLCPHPILWFSESDNISSPLAVEVTSSLGPTAINLSLNQDPLKSQELYFVVGKDKVNTPEPSILLLCAIFFFKLTLFVYA